MTDYHMDIANFNLTFGKEEEPLLEHFDDFVFPAFTADFRRERGDSKYFFQSVEIVNTDLGLAISGTLVKDTKLEVLSVYDPETQYLNEENKSYPTSPYSLFYIFLKNHRMAFIPNQKGSPRLGEFASTVRYALTRYRRQYNKEKTKEKKLPVAQLSVVGIASKASIEAELRKVEKISSLKIIFYPLNGEDFNELSGLGANLVKQMESVRKTVGSNTGNTVLNSPEDKESVAKLVEGLSGKADPTMQVKYLNGSRGKIKNEEIAQRVDFGLEGNQGIREKDKILAQTKSIPALNKESETNTNLYKRFSNIIKKYLNKKN
ncbi:hypothetical protein IWT25_00460 [Secundilactobacillus pentosiphilus]|uniref:Uncharacterized protein n=1 Tax=Secundilactobacillus pentosiphilus TaxID=1714682 RepID=A0A1Z5ITR4_9LACO|nr:hypothetical protein [Secundilactobacillus pentosiphilus]GAX05157.1 hypothetical protein IWT25_00460 [Secundilactobacillus pentosiphilus]